MTKFEKPRGERDYPDYAVEATVKALIDAGVSYGELYPADFLSLSAKLISRKFR
jgi:hypothetical protein